MRYWWFFIFVFISIILLERYLHLEPRPLATFGSRPFFVQLEENFRLVSFQVVSIITTTGFGTKDIGTPYFGMAAKQLFLIMMVIGGCVGSTGGGIKVLRIGILIQVIRRELFRLRVSPRAISEVLIDGQPVGRDEVFRVSGLFFTWILLLIVGGLTTALLSKWDAVQSVSGMFSALGNIGPCYIPVAEMGMLHPVVKITYIIGMLAGRLEILPVLLFLSPRAWKA
jgi:trk system potassium uptake protein TrkH